MSLALERAEEAFRHFLAGVDPGSAPALLSVECCRAMPPPQHRYIARFDDGRDWRWHVALSDYREPQEPVAFVEYQRIYDRLLGVERRTYCFFSPLADDPAPGALVTPAQIEAEHRLESQLFLEGISQRMRSVVYYGVAEPDPTAFRGVIDSYGASPFLAAMRREREQQEFIERMVRPPIVAPGPGVTMTAREVVARENERIAEYNGVAIRTGLPSARWRELSRAIDIDVDGAGPSPQPIDHAAVNAKAEELLRDWLKPDQLAEYLEHGHFHVIGGTSGRRYRIRKGEVVNIVALNGDGSPHCKLCFEPMGSLPVGDVMLAQKLSLELDERRALDAANLFAIDPDEVLTGPMDSRPTVARAVFRGVPILVVDQSFSILPGSVKYVGGMPEAFPDEAEAVGRDRATRAGLAAMLWLCWAAAMRVFTARLVTRL